MFFQSAPINVSDALKEQGRKLLSPSSNLCPLADVRGTEGLITVQGEVVEVSYSKTCSRPFFIQSIHSIYSPPPLGLNKLLYTLYNKHDAVLN